MIQSLQPTNGQARVFASFDSIEAAKAAYSKDEITLEEFEAQARHFVDNEAA